jgi:hypothetical protein
MIRFRRSTGAGGRPSGATAPSRDGPPRLAEPVYAIAYRIKITAKPTGEFTVFEKRLHQDVPEAELIS